MKIDPNQFPKPAYVWWACEDGWHRFHGYVLQISELDCSVVLEPEPFPRLVVSELNSGIRIADIEVTMLELIMIENRSLIRSLVNELISTFGEAQIQKINSYAAKCKLNYEKRFGEMPDIECEIT